MRNTSIEAYNKILKEGLLTGAKFSVYEILFQNGPLTAGEIFEISQRINIGHTIVKGSVCARLTELESQGVVEEVGTRKWKATGHTSILWDVNDKLPAKMESKQSKNEIISELREENEALRRQVCSMKKKIQTQQELFSWEK